MSWINLSEEEPEELQWVLCYNPQATDQWNIITIQCYMPFRWDLPHRWCFATSEAGQQITHWMKRPAAP